MMTMTWVAASVLLLLAAEGTVASELNELLIASTVRNDADMVGQLQVLGIVHLSHSVICLRVSKDAFAKIY